MESKTQPKETREAYILVTKPNIHFRYGHKMSLIPFLMPIEIEIVS